MAITVINPTDTEFKDYADVFYNNFSPDDWDWMIIGDNFHSVDLIASKLKVFYYKIKYDVDTNKWYAVTYHS